MNNIIILVGLVIISSIVVFLLEKKFIKFMKDRILQPFLKEGPDHTKKIGTPTMGGIPIIISFVVITLVLSVLISPLFFKIPISIFQIIIIILIIIGYSLIGLQDDYLKIKHSQNDKGLTPKQKLFFQFLFSILIFSILNDTILNIYLFNSSINLGVLYYIMIPVIIVGFSNATNLTDGLDGLLTSNVIITLIFLSIIAFFNNNEYNYIIILNIVMIGCLIGFLCLNKNPAKIFMGDVGSLAMGAYISIIAIILHIELLLILFGIVYILETISVMMQVSYYKYTKKKTGVGKRLLLIAPLHHHFEKKGFSENQIVVGSLVINVFFGLIGLLIYIN